MKKAVYIDIHAHIIPGVDDGAQSLEEAVKMMEQAYAESIRAIIATPHFGIRNTGYNDKTAKKRLNELQKIADKQFPGLKLFMGNELYYSVGTLESLQKKWAHTLAGTNYVLIEFSTDVEYDKIANAVEEMRWNGYWPIIAHAERYHCLIDNIELAKQLVNMGAYIQINARSFIRTKKRREKKKRFFLEQNRDWCMELLKAGYVHFIASDAHSTGTRRPVYESAVSEIIAQGGEEQIHQITQTNITKLLRNEKI